MICVQCKNVLVAVTMTVHEDTPGSQENKAWPSTQNPTVTWLLSVKNSMPFLPETLASIERQTYKNHQVLAWDDCSTDGSLEELQRWIPNRLPGKIFAHQSKTLGASLAFLVEQASTELCARIDGDDVNLPTRLEKQVSFLLGQPHIGIAGGQISVINENGEIQDAGHWWTYATADALLRWRSRWQSQFCHPAVMFRRSIVLEAGNYRDVKAAEDSDLWLRLCERTGMANMTDKILHYRRSRSSTTGKVVEFLPYERETALRNATILFPNISAPQRAMELWEATHPLYLSNPSRFRDLFELKGAAIALAKKVGKDRNYFLNTATFQEQYESLKIRFYERQGVLSLRKSWHRLLGRA